MLTAHLRLSASVLLASACACAAHAQAQDEEQVRVAVDWRQVSDADVARCGLSRLRAGTLERLVGEGYAVVDAVDERGIDVAVASVEGGLKVALISEAVGRSELIRLEPDCDSTFVLEVIARISALVDEVKRQRPPPPKEVVISEPDPIAPQPQRPASSGALHAQLDALARASDAASFAFGGGLTLRGALGAGMQLGGRLELAGNAVDDVTVLEGGLLVASAFQPQGAELGLAFELGPLLHHATSAALSATELDGVAAVGPQLSLGHFLGQLLFFVRLRRFEHRVLGETAWDSGRVGVMLRLGAQLSGS